MSLHVITYTCSVLMKHIHVAQTVDGWIFGPLSICVLDRLREDCEQKSLEKTNYTEVGQYVM